MRRSNCSSPINPQQPSPPTPIPQGSPRVRGKICVIKKGGVPEKRVILVISDKKTGAAQKSDVLGGARGDGAKTI